MDTKLRAAGAAIAPELPAVLGCDVAGMVDSATDGRGFDVVFDATGGSDIATSFQAARVNGQVVT